MGGQIGHTSVRRGKRVKVFLRNGDSYIDRFIEHRSKYIVLKETGRVSTSILKKLAIFKGGIL